MIALGQRYKDDDLICFKKNYLIFRILFHFYIPATCESNQIIKSISPTAERSVGEDVALTCTVENPSDYLVVWSKKNKENPTEPFTLSFNAQLTLKDPRFNLTTTQNSYSLHVSFSIMPLMHKKIEYELSRGIMFDYIEISFRFVILNMVMQHYMSAKSL